MGVSADSVNYRYPYTNALRIKFSRFLYDQGARKLNKLKTTNETRNRQQTSGSSITTNEDIYEEVRYDDESADHLQGNSHGF